MRRALGLALILVALGAGLAVRYAGRLLVVNDPLPHSADAIVILAGSIPDRVLEAVDLYNAGIAPRIVVTRERPLPGTPLLAARGVRMPDGAEQTVFVLRHLGVPGGVPLVLQRRTFSTASEARTIARYAYRHRLRRLLVVTSRSHTRRARLILRRALGPGVALAVRASRYDPFPADRWWHVRHQAKVVLREYQQLAHHWLRERWSIQPCGGLRRRSRA